MYRKVLIPLDGSKEAEGVLSAIRSELEENCEVILLQVIHPGRMQMVGGIQIYSDQDEQDRRNRAMFYLSTLCDSLQTNGLRCRADVVVENSIAEGIVSVATKEDVELITMYTHDRKGLAKFINRSIASSVERKAPIEVKIFKPAELTATVSA